MNLFITSDYANTEKSCFINFGDFCHPQHGKSKTNTCLRPFFSKFRAVFIGVLLYTELYVHLLQFT